MTYSQAIPCKGTIRKILLADDEPVGSEIVTAMLERRGHWVTVVEDGRSILETLQLERFDLLLCDISLPDMDGTDVVKIIRSGKRDRIDPFIPIIALTAHALPHDREHFLSCGMDRYISKPVNFDELLGLIEETCSIDRCPVASEAVIVSECGMKDTSAGNRVSAALQMPESP